MKRKRAYKAPVYPADKRYLVEDEFSLQNYLLGETVFALSNGFIGMRGSFEEGLSSGGESHITGTYVGGFYESVPIPHAEKGYGYAVNSQTLLNVTDARLIAVYLGEERLDLQAGSLVYYRRALDLEEAHLSREFIWRSPGGREIKVRVSRLVSLRHRNLAAIKFQVEPLNCPDQITLVSVVNGAVDNHIHAEEDPRFSASLGGLGLAVEQIIHRDTMAAVISATKRSGLAIACAVENKLSGAADFSLSAEQGAEKASLFYRITPEPASVITLEKYIAYYTSREHPREELADLSIDLVSGAKVGGYERLLEDQRLEMNRFWQLAAVDLEGSQLAAQGLRYALFHLRQALPGDARVGIGAKGLTSEGYDGHYFWDTEIYMMPFYTALVPGEARKLLEYRYSILEQARKRARELSHPAGALYPWRTIAGEEGSSYYPAGTAQYHINAAIAYAIELYTEMSGDYSFMVEMGAEIVFETARLWADLGAYIERKDGKFCFNEVTGPDEYTALVNNNCYTNLMARYHLDLACRTARTMKSDHRAMFSSLSGKISLTEEEILEWRRAADNTYIPYDRETGIHPQDDGFLDKEVWDFSATPEDSYPLLLHYHPMVIYRYQVCKQPDVILAHLLLGDQFSLEQKRRDYLYYEPITTHDSSLSPSIFSVVASELGFNDDAINFFLLSARLDLDNLFGDSHFGVHLANMAGTWMSVVYGFAGMRAARGELRLNPYLPRGYSLIRFRFYFRKSLLQVEIAEGRATYTLLKGDSIRFKHGQKDVFLARGDRANFGLTKTVQ